MVQITHPENQNSIQVLVRITKDLLLFSSPAPFLKALRTGLDKSLPGWWLAYYPVTPTNKIPILLVNRTIFRATLPEFMVEWLVDFHTGTPVIPLDFVLYFRYHNRYQGPGYPVGTHLNPNPNTKLQGEPNP